jgi:hypothetical protein
MGMVLPDDHGSLEVWGLLVNAALTTNDAHDHTPGKGVLIPAAALNINGDVSWSSGGTSRSITDLKAIDFIPSAAAGMTALAGAFFVSDGTGGLSANELYYRTTAGTNVKFTSGAALNVAAFTGGIGGDYSAAGALVVFDDATDSYWFQQQVGTGVRQYARMRNADIDFYEFKANPTAGVPTNRVRLKSPAALAASYDLTMPAALQAAGSRPLTVTSAGLVAASAELLMFNGASATPLNAGPTVGAGGIWTFGNNSSVICPIFNAVNQSATAWSAMVNKLSSGAVTITAALIETNIATGVNTTVNTASNNAAAPGFFPLSGVVSGIGNVLATGKVYSISVTVSGGGAGDQLVSWSITP